MKSRYKFSLVLFSFATALLLIQACTIKKGYESLGELDYFKAKKNLHKSMKYHPEAGSYGLAVLYSRNDNPFYDKDSAYVYISIADTSWSKIKVNKQEKLKAYNYTRESIDSMKQVISSQFYQEAEELHTVEAYSEFLMTHPWSNDYQKALAIRDSIAFYTAVSKNSAEAYREFMDTYPSSQYVSMAEDNYFNSHYYENTADGSIDSYMRFIEEYPQSPMREEAEYNVYKLVTEPNTVEAYELFVLGYGDNRNVEKAWDEFFQVYLHDYSEERIGAFLEKYSYAPNTVIIEEEKAWSSVVMLPYIQDGLYGFVSEKGKPLIEPQFEYAGSFKDGLAVVVQNGLYGFIDKFGNKKIPCEYELASNFHEGRSIVERDGKLGLIDRNNKLLLNFIYEDLGDVSNELIYVSQDDKYGYADWNGQLIIPEQFDEAYDFHDRLAKVEKDGLFGMINPQGVYVIESKYDDLTSLSDSLFICEENGRKGIITYNGTIVVPPVYDQIGALKDGLSLVSKGDTVEYINSNGEVIISKGYRTFPNFLFKGEFDEGSAIVYKKGKYGKVNAYGNVITSIEYENIGRGSKFAPFQKGDNWGLMSTDDKVLISPLYQSIDLVDDKYVIARKDDSLGVMDVFGDVIIPFKHSSIDYIAGGVFSVGDYGNLALYDEANKLTESEYQKIEIEVFNVQFISLVKKNKIEYYDRDAKKLIEIQTFIE